MFLFLVKRIGGKPCPDATESAVIIARSRKQAKALFPRAYVPASTPRPAGMSPFQEHVSLETRLRLSADVIGYAPQASHASLVLQGEAFR